MRGDWFWKVAAVLVLIDATAGSVCAAGTDIFSLRFDLGLWSIVVFLGLYFILKKAAWGPILKGLQKRESDIRVAVEEAKLAREETKQRQAEFERKFAEAQAEIPKLMEEGRRAALALKEEMRSQAQQENQIERERLHREIQTAKDQALQDVFMQLGQMATLIASKIISRSLSGEDHRRLVDEAMAEMKEAEERRR